MTRPSPRLTWWGYCIIRASYELPGKYKLVLGLIRELDRGQGCFKSPALMARELGMSLSHFDAVRSWCQRIGLLVRAPVRGEALDRWFVRLPADFELDKPADQKADDWLRYWADELDRRVRLADKDPGKSVNDPRKSGVEAPEDRGSGTPPTPENQETDPRKSGATEHENAGREPPSLQTTGSTPRSAPTAVGQALEDQPGVIQKTQAAQTEADDPPDLVGEICAPTTEQVEKAAAAKQRWKAAASS